MTPAETRNPAAVYRNLWVATMVVLAFVLGYGVGDTPGLLSAQGREPLPTPNTPTPPTVNVPGVGNLPIPDIEGILEGSTTVPQAGQGIYYAEGNQTGVTGDGILAVTGSYGIGTSVLYVIDTKTKQLAVYEARGGGRGSRRLYLVGARKIGLDLQLLGYNDKSDYLYEDLQERFERRSETPGEPTTEK